MAATPAARRHHGLFIFDADCAMCSRAAEWLAKTHRLQVIAWQSADLSRFALTPEATRREAYWIDRQGRKRAAHLSIGYALIARGRAPALLGAAVIYTPLRPIAAAIYRIVAVNRHRIRMRGQTCLVGPAEQASPQAVPGPSDSPGSKFGRAEIDAAQGPPTRQE
jgi:predicted DCC family thiol-disulfide oxidoreductase YuxK